MLYIQKGEHENIIDTLMIMVEHLDTIKNLIKNIENKFASKW